MRRIALVVALVGCLGPLGASTPASGKAAVTLSASPNPVAVGNRVVHTVEVGLYGRLDVWVSASGFWQPGSGTLPAGTWWQECCPAQTAGTAAWHYRSSGPVSPGSYRFGAEARRVGSFRSTASVGVASSSVWIEMVRV